jgi:hypothetical protein
MQKITSMKFHWKSMEQEPSYYVQMENDDEVDRCISQLFVVNAPKRGTDIHFSDG